MDNVLYADSTNNYIHYFNVEELAEKNGLMLRRYGDKMPSGTTDSYLAYACFSNEHNTRRKKNKSIDVYYFMNRVGKKDKWVAGKVYSLEIEGLKTNDKKPWGGLFPDVPTF